MSSCLRICYGNVYLNKIAVLHFNFNTGISFNVSLKENKKYISLIVSSMKIKVKRKQL